MKFKPLCLRGETFFWAQKEMATLLSQRGHYLIRR